MNGSRNAGNDPLLRVRNLSLSFRRDGRRVPILHGVSFAIRPGECLALVGESGCGKSLTCLALTRLPPTDVAELSGTVDFLSRELLTAGAETLRQVRREALAYIFQNPGGSLNPVLRVSSQVYECIPNPSRSGRYRDLCRLLARVDLPARCADAYPCELSGGQQQRVMIAMAMARRPRLLVADEPTTALDVVTQKRVLDLLCRVCRETGTALLLVTHNLGLVADRADHVAVMYSGHVVECGPVEPVLGRPSHPYTRGLLRAVPSLAGRKGDVRDIPGTVPPPGDLPDGCSFHPRCAYADGRCRTELPLDQAAAAGNGVSVRCHYPLSCGQEDAHA